MFYKYNQVSSRILPSEATLVQGSSRVATAEVTYIPAYKPSTGLNFGGGSRVKALQSAFRSSGGGRPVFLLGPRDVVLYRSVMLLSLGGISVALYSIYKMATGSMQKKEN